MLDSASPKAERTWTWPWFFFFRLMVYPKVVHAQERINYRLNIFFGVSNIFFGVVNIEELSTEI